MADFGWSLLGCDVMAGVPGNDTVSDATLVSAAARGDRDSFGWLFERHLPAVFETACLVLRDREGAAEVARDTFVDAWADIGSVPPEAFEHWLLARAHARALGWLEMRSPARPGAATTQQGLVAGTSRPPSMGPVLRARLVAALEAEGVPTRARLAAVGLVQRVAELFGNTGVRLGAVAAVLLVFGLTGILVVKGGPGAGDAAATGDDPRLTGTTTTAAETTTSTTTSTSTTTTTTTTTTTVPATTTSRPTTTTSPPTTAPPAPPAPPPPPPATDPPPAAEVESFWGFYFGDGNCGWGEQQLSLWWETRNATSARIRPEGGEWITVDVPDGSTRVCSERRTRWTIEASNSTGTGSSSFEP